MCSRSPTRPSARSPRTTSRPSPPTRKRASARASAADPRAVFSLLAPRAPCGRVLCVPPPRHSTSLLATRRRCLLSVAITTCVGPSGMLTPSLRHCARCDGAQHPRIDFCEPPRPPLFAPSHRRILPVDGLDRRAEHIVERARTERDQRRRLLVGAREQLQGAPLRVDPRVCTLTVGTFPQRHPRLAAMVGDGRQRARHGLRQLRPHLILEARAQRLRDRRQRHPLPRLIALEHAPPSRRGTYRRSRRAGSSAPHAAPHPPRPARGRGQPRPSGVHVARPRGRRGAAPCEGGGVGAAG